MSWKFEARRRLPRPRNAILIEGLPGIGNIGKVAVDFLVDRLRAERLYSISSHTMPHSVFVNEQNMIELPSIELFYRAGTSRRPDLLLLTGDVQPLDEVSCYDFCERLLDLARRFRVTEIITIGGIGLQDVPKYPRLYCTGNNRQMIDRYCKGVSMSNKIYGVVGPIVGVSGLLLGLAERRGMPAIAMLAETLGHPLYLGIKGSREVLKVLNAKLHMGMNLKELDKEIKGLETEMLQKTKELSQISKETAIKKIEGKFGKDVTYIG